DAAVPAAVVVMAVAVVLEVRLVVLLVVGPEIGQRETVMRGDEVDARPGATAAVLEEVRRAEKAGGEARERLLLALPVAADIVAIAAVPLGPAGREVAELIAVRPDIPRFGDQLDGVQHRVLGDRVEEDRAGVELIVFAAELRREVE